MLQHSTHCPTDLLQGDAQYTADAVVITHDLTRMSAVSFANLSQAGSQVVAADVIAVDEGQFFPGKHLPVSF